METWGAICLSTPGMDKSGFNSRKEAEKYTYKFFCQSCRNSIAKRIRAERNGIDVDNIMNRKLSEDEYCYYLDKYGDYYPPCSAEWFIEQTNILDKCETVTDVLEMMAEGKLK